MLTRSVFAQSRPGKIGPRSGGVRGRSKVCTKFAVVPQFVVLPVFQFTSRPWSQEKISYKICSSPSICRGHDRQQFFGKTESIISGLQKFDNLSRPYEIRRHSCRSRVNADTQRLCTVTSGKNWSRIRGGAGGCPPRERLFFPVCRGSKGCSFLSAEVVPSSAIPIFN